MTALEEGVKLYTERYGDGSNGGAVLWGQEVLHSTYWSKQVEIIGSVFENERTVVRACHDSSKTFTAADIILAFLCLCFPCKVVTTAPTFHQVRNLLWSEINRKFAKFLAEEMPGIQCLQTRVEIEPDWFAVGLSPRETVSFTGFHQENVLVVFDEAPGVRPEIVEAAETLMAGGNAHCLWIGNPTDSSGHFYNAFRSGQWNKIAIGYKDTPNFIDMQDDPDPMDVNLPESIKRELISKQWVESRKKEWGEDSPLFISRVEGDFPPSGERQVISLGLCEAAANRDVLPEGDIHLGVDVARFGDDLTVYTPRRGNVLMDQITEGKKDTMEVTGRIAALHKEFGYATIPVDVIGVGAGVLDRGKEIGLPVVSWDVRRKANDTDKFFNKRTEAWFGMADWLKYGRIPKDDELIADLTAPQYSYTSDGKYKVESKDDTKKRLGRSPDRADSAIAATQGTSVGSVGMW